MLEAKDNTHTVGGGMRQVLDYSEILGVPFTFSSNGDGFLEHECTGRGGAVERELALDALPSPAELWARCIAAKGLTVQQAG